LHSYTADALFYIHIVVQLLVPKAWEIYGKQQERTINKYIWMHTKQKLHQSIKLLDNWSKFT